MARFATLGSGELDGRYAGVKVINSAGAWTDVVAVDATINAAGVKNITGEVIPAGSRFISIKVRETGGENPCYIIFKAEDDEVPATDAFEIPAGSTAGYRVNMNGKAISTISIYGVAKVEAFLL